MFIIPTQGLADRNIPEASTQSHSLPANQLISSHQCKTLDQKTKVAGSWGTAPEVDLRSLRAHFSHKCSAYKHTHIHMSYGLVTGTETLQRMPEGLQHARTQGAILPYQPPNLVPWSSRFLLLINFWILSNFVGVNKSVKTHKQRYLSDLLIMACVIFVNCLDYQVHTKF